MTSETYNFIDLSDLIGMKMECTACRSAMIIPFEEARKEAPQRCPNCGEHWGNGNPSARPTSNFIAMVFQSVAALKRELGSDSPVGFTFSLEVSAPGPDALA
jgi:hypothetical protein